MNKVIVFILGFITGGVCLFIIGLLAMLYINRGSEKYNDIDYFEVNGCNGVVTLHTYMPKDSVRMLVGAPADTTFTYNTYENCETWTYEFDDQNSKEHIRILKLRFEDGGLYSVSDNKMLRELYMAL